MGREVLYLVMLVVAVLVSVGVLPQAWMWLVLVGVVAALLMLLRRQTR
jgi:hypothetical protein